jgi:hypothetical protein
MGRTKRLLALESELEIILAGLPGAFEYVRVLDGSSRLANKSCILGGGTRGGPIVCAEREWLCETACCGRGMARRSGELFPPYCDAPRGTRDGILDGDLNCEAGAVDVTDAGAAWDLVPGRKPVGVFVAFRLGAGPLIALAGLAGATERATDAGWLREVGGGPAGVFERGARAFGVLDLGGGAFTSITAISSK